MYKLKKLETIIMSKQLFEDLGLINIYLKNECYEFDHLKKENKNQNRFRLYSIKKIKRYKVHHRLTTTTTTTTHKN